MLPQGPPEDLNDRARNILRSLIREYVRTGKPVGSRKLARLHREGISAATVRNVVADLEELGLVTQPHTSAGRVPTGEGYRFYVDELLERRKLSSREADEIHRSLEQETDPDELMSKACRILSSLSENVGVVVAPPLTLAVMQHIEFVRLAPGRILVLLVTRGGLVQHRLIPTDQDFAQSELDQAGRYLVDHFAGWSLPRIRDELLRLMSEEKALYDRLLGSVVTLGSAGLAGAETEKGGEGEIYIGGAARILGKPELSDVNRLITLFQTFEEKSRLVKIIGECLKEERIGPTVTIGLEKHLPGMRDWALVASPYQYDHQAIGGLGILGPARMEYDKVISLVDYVASLFGKILSRN